MKKYEDLTMDILLFSVQDVLTVTGESNDNATDVPEFDEF